MIAFLLCLCCFYVHNADRQNSEQVKKVIVCTTMMLADLVKNLVPSEQFFVCALMGPGVDPHTYKAKPSDVTALLQAELIIYNGLHLEGKMGELLQELKQKRPVFCAADAIAKEMLISSGYEGIYDPHIWHDIELWKQVACGVYQKLCTIFPQDILVFDDLYNAYKLLLDKTSQDIALYIEKISPDRRILITAHDAFRYFGVRYNYTVLGLQGLSTESDIGIRDIYNLADIIVEKKVSAIFPESCISPRNMIALQEVVSKKGGAISVGGELFSDSLSTIDGFAPTYTKMLLHNAKTIVDALE